MPTKIPTIVRGDNTGVNGAWFLKVGLKGKASTLQWSKAVLQVHGTSLLKEFLNPQFPIALNFTGEESITLPLGYNKLFMSVWDEQGRKTTFKNPFIFAVLNEETEAHDEPSSDIISQQDGLTIEFDYDNDETQVYFKVNYYPQKTSELENDSGFITSSQIPSKTSDLINDSGFLTEHQNISHLATKNELSNKVDKVLGKGLSANDFTNFYVDKIDSIEAGAEVNRIDSVNGKVGDVFLNAQDVGALPNNTVIPTKTSQLTNDSGFLTEHQDISGKANIEDLATVATSGSYADLTNKPTIPEDLGDLTNNAGYIKGITSADVTTALGYTPYNSTNPNSYQANILEGVQVNGTDLTPTDKKVNIDLSDYQQQATVTTISSNDSITLADNTCFKGGSISAFTITVPSTAIYPFVCEIDFTSPSTATTITYSGTIVWAEGSDDITSDVFVPVASKEYTIMIWNNGTSYCGIAKGV